MECLADSTDTQEALLDAGNPGSSEKDGAQRERFSPAHKELMQQLMAHLAGVKATKGDGELKAYMADVIACVNRVESTENSGQPDFDSDFYDCDDRDGVANNDNGPMGDGHAGYDGSPAAAVAVVEESGQQSAGQDSEAAVTAAAEVPQRRTRVRVKKRKLVNVMAKKTPKPVYLSSDDESEADGEDVYDVPLSVEEYDDTGVYDASIAEMLSQALVETNPGEQLRKFLTSDQPETKVREILSRRGPFASESICSEFLFVLLVVYWKVNPVKMKNDRARRGQSAARIKIYHCDTCNEPLFHTIVRDGQLTWLRWGTPAQSRSRPPNGHTCDPLLTKTHLLKEAEKAHKQYRREVAKRANTESFAVVPCGEDGQLKPPQRELYFNKPVYSEYLERLFGACGYDSYLVQQLLMLRYERKRHTLFASRFLSVYADALDRYSQTIMRATPRQAMTQLVGRIASFTVFNSLLDGDRLSHINAAFGEKFKVQDILYSVKDSMRRSLKHSSPWQLRQHTDDTMILSIMATIDGTRIGVAVGYDAEGKYLISTRSAAQIRGALEQANVYYSRDVEEESIQFTQDDIPLIEIDELDATSNFTEDCEEDEIQSFIAPAMSETREGVPIIQSSRVSAILRSDIQYEKERSSESKDFVVEAKAFQASAGDAGHERIKKLFFTVNDITPSDKVLNVISVDATFLSMKTQDQENTFTTLFSAHCITADCKVIPLAYMLSESEESILNWQLFLKNIKATKSDQFDWKKTAFVSDNHASIRAALSIVFWRDEVKHFQCFKHLMRNIENRGYTEKEKRIIIKHMTLAGHTLDPEVFKTSMEKVKKVCMERVLKESKKNNSNPSFRTGSTEHILTEVPEAWTRIHRVDNHEVFTSNASELDNLKLNRWRCTNVLQLAFQAIDNCYTSARAHLELHSSMGHQQVLFRIPSVMLNIELCFSGMLEVDSSEVEFNEADFDRTKGALRVKAREGIDFKVMSSVACKYLKKIRRKKSWFNLRRGLLNSFETLTATVSFNSLSKHATKMVCWKLEGARCSVCKDTNGLYSCAHVISATLAINKMTLPSGDTRCVDYFSILKGKLGFATVVEVFNISPTSVPREVKGLEGFLFPSPEENIKRAGAFKEIFSASLAEKLRDITREGDEGTIGSQRHKSHVEIASSTNKRQKLSESRN